MSYSAAVITISDRSYRGEREDESGKLLASLLEEDGYDPVSCHLIPDEGEMISEKLIELSEEGIALILTSGGTGLSPRDSTPEATLAVLEKETRGISEYIRIEGLKKTPRSALSRAVSGLRKKSLIINLPGSPKAVREAYEALSVILPHALETVNSNTLSCGG